MLWAALREETRYMLGEEVDVTSDDSRWDDEHLTASANRCLRRLSSELPLAAIANLDAVRGLEEYDLPDDFIQVQAVVHPTGTVRIQKSGPLVSGSQPGSNMIRRSRNQAWYWIHARSLHLVPTPSETATEAIALYYHRSRIPLVVVAALEEGETPAEDAITDETQEIDIEPDEANLIQEWIKADMMASVISPDALLTRWKERGSRDDSPLIPAAKQFYALFEQALEAIKRQRSSPVLNLSPVTPRRRRYGRTW